MNRRDNKNKTIGSKVEYDGEEDAATRAVQLQKCKNSTPNTDITNDRIYYSCCTSASRNNNKDKNTDGTETVTNTETNTVTTNDKGNNEKVVEAGAGAEVEADTNSEISNSSNDIGSSNVETKILKRLDEIENKMMVNNVRYNGESPSKQESHNNKNVEIRGQYLR